MQSLEKVEDGRWCATVDLQDGTPPQKFYGETQDDVFSELIKAQTNATRTIREQKRVLKTRAPEVDPARNVPEFKPRSLDANARYQLAQDISDPAKSAEAIRQYIEAEFGAPVETVRETLAQATEQAERNRCMAEAQKFLREHPDFIESAENEQLVVQYLQSRNMGYSAKNLAIAYDDLKDSELLQLKAVQQVAPVGRPRSASTGIPARSTSRTPSTPVGPTAEDINNMSREEYQRRMSDPQFRAHVDKIFAPK